MSGSKVPRTELLGTPEVTGEGCELWELSLMNWEHLER